MCYICEARGTAGKNYKVTQKAIAAAKRVLHGRFGFDRTKPAAHKAWSAADLKAYGKEYARRV